jgi:phosphoribosylformylglycinamidine cyclo-ligase
VGAVPERLGGPASGGMTYAAAGVDIEAGEEAVRRIAEAVRSTRRPEVASELGGFAGAFRLGRAGGGDVLLVASTDGVGTKAAVAAATGRYDTIGIDLVAMCVDDVVCTGAEPLFLLDYLAVGRLDPATAAVLVGGVAQGCRQAGVALLGGEMAEHPGTLEPGSFDLAGFAVGVVEPEALLGPERVRVGDALVGIGSGGLRCNGYALARRALLVEAGRRLDEPAWPGADHSLADELLRPSIVYASSVLALAGAVTLRAVAHVTGGGIPGNLARVLPRSCDAVVEGGSWAVPRVFQEIRRAGGISDEEMTKVFNLGLGMVAVVAPEDAPRAVEVLGDLGLEASRVGHVEAGTGRVRFTGPLLGG